MKLKQLWQDVRTRFMQHSSPDYIASLYQQMHEQNRFKGTTWRDSFQDLQKAIPDVRQLKVLDFGCGPLGGIAAELGDQVISFDPHVEKFSASPWDRSFDVVFSGDVLEHMTRSDIRHFLNNVRTSQAEYLFLVISTRRASKSLPNGVNAHITVKPDHWWLKEIARGLGNEFQAVMARSDMLRREVKLCFRRASAVDKTSKQAA